MKRKINVNKIRVSNLFIVFILLFFIILICRLTYLALATEVDGINLHEFMTNRNTRKKVVHAKRGNIYDAYGNTLVQTVNSYTVIAYLDESRSSGYKTPQHVVDKEMTAKALSPIIGMSEEAILKLLNRSAYQVELGPGGRDITELKKDEIAALNLPGISFISSYKRYYQNDDFASYILGYSKANEDGEIVGEMGVEQYYNEELNGKDGYTIYEQDAYGYKIPNTYEETKNATDGVDIYLTLDSNIQFFAEKYSKEVYEQYNPEWLVTVVADAKTGAILASTSYPSFNPNIKNMTNYLNPLVSYSYEPGSTFKTFTYMAALEKGVYKGNDTFKSGSIKVGNNTIYDWLTSGFGIITYDEGYLYSSNVGITHLVQDYFTADELREYYKKFGFGKKTGIELPGELSGTLNFKYEVEIANAGFGQGITVTPVQMIQGLTTISNDGVMLKPYIVDKIVDPNTDEIIYNGSRTELGRVASKETTDYMKDLMYKVIYNDLYYSTGAAFKLDGYNIVGKTGTAQYTNPNTGAYYFDELHYIRSFSGMFPKDDPEVIIYVAIKRPYEQARGLNTIVKGLIKDIANYKGLLKDEEELKDSTYKLSNYSNKSVSEVKQELETKFSEVVVIGNGTKVINQYPNANSNVSLTDKVYLVTNGDITMPNLLNWSLKEVSAFSKLANIKLDISGTGYVVSQSIEAGIILKDNDILTIELVDKIKNKETIEEGT